MSPSSSAGGIFSLVEYLRRTLDYELDELLAVAPAIAIDGPKGVGKTATALGRADTTWFLDDPAQRDVARADTSFDTAPRGTFLLDEWQRLPQVWDSVRRQVDAGAPPGRFLLTGSATPVDAAGTHSGAGRILSLRMRPMGLHERGLCTPTVSLSAMLRGEQPDVSGASDFSLLHYAQAIEASGFPGIMGAAPRLRRSLLNAYIQRVIDRDLPDQGYRVRQPEMLRRWLAAYAAASSTTTAYSRLLDATTGGEGSQPSRKTTETYREHLTQLWLLDPVPGWLPTNNPLKRLGTSPKHQLVDPALALRLLGMTADSLSSPAGAHMAGPLFESLVTLGVRVIAQAAEANVYHLRARDGGREIDLIVQGIDGRLVAIEVKLAPQVSDSDVRHLNWLREELGEMVADCMVVTTGSTAYRRPDGIAVVPLALLGY